MAKIAFPLVQILFFFQIIKRWLPVFRYVTPQHTITGFQYMWLLLKGILTTVDPSVSLDTKWKCQLNGRYNPWVKALQMLLQGLFGDGLRWTGSSSQALIGRKESWKVPKKVSGCQHSIICSGPHTVQGRGVFDRWQVICFLFLPLSPLFTLPSPAHTSVNITSSTDSKMKFSAPYNFNLQSGSVFNSLGGRRKSLSQGLFAVRHYTWAETPGQTQMCLMVGGSGWTQCGASTNKTRTVEKSQDAFQGFMFCQSRHKDLMASCVEEEAVSVIITESRDWEMFEVLFYSILHCNRNGSLFDCIITSTKMVMISLPFIRLVYCC